ncbi:MAG TPA: sodium-independent anion transporter, partial [Acidimicrobiales bacterium]|nr:sodium-independent anion transporter [Acidimicrobiales bacterium]
GRVPGLSGYHDVRSFPDAERLPGAAILRWDAPLLFANARTFREHVSAIVRAQQPKWIIIAAEPITDVDTTAADMLEDLDGTLNARGITFVFAEMKDPVRRKLERYGLTAMVDRFFPTLEDAVTAYRAETGADWVPAPPHEQV